MLAAPSLGKRQTKLPDLTPLRLLPPLAWARETISFKMHDTEGRVVTGPSNILFPGVYVCTSIFNPEIWQAVAAKGLINCSFLPLTQPSWMTGRKKPTFFQAWFEALNKCLKWNHLLTHLFCRPTRVIWTMSASCVVSVWLTFNFKSFTIQKLLSATSPEAPKSWFARQGSVNP